MHAGFQRRVQRYGWDLAAADYEPLWQAQLAGAQQKLLACAAAQPGENVLDVACGTGLVTFPLAGEVGASGRVVGVDLSGQMVEEARARAMRGAVANVGFARMDAENLELPDGSFDLAVCALGLMYLPDPGRALREMRRVLRPGGRMAAAVWGERSRCGWAELFPIVDAEVRSEVCPMFFSLGGGESLPYLCQQEKFTDIEHHRIDATLAFANATEACNAAFIGGPVALAWSRFDDSVKARVCARYLESIAPWRQGLGYRLPGEFVVISAKVPA